MEKIEDKIYYYMDGKNIIIEKIMERYNNYIYAIINKSNIFFSKEDKEEILLDVYLILWNNAKKLDVDKSMSAYICGITKHLIYKRNRNNKKIANLEDYIDTIPSKENIEYDYLLSSENKIFVDALQKMSKQDQEIFISYYYEEMKIKDIAILQKMTESNVKTKLFRIRKKLKKFLLE